MHDASLLLLPFLALVGAGLAALWGLPALNHRLTTVQAAWLVALAPLTAFVILLGRLPPVLAGTTLVWRQVWMPSLDMAAMLYLDGLGALFALLVSGIGTLVVIYTGYYFRGDAGAWRFLTYLLLFMATMLGLVLAGDVITLFVFWEGTSITSFLLIGYKTKDEEARRGAFKALFITGGGGIALLAGLVFVAVLAGGTDYPTILSRGDVLTTTPLYPVVLGLIAFGAFTKSAQTPAHIWLPAAMTAPTPASAYLHSATMVKAGVYLLARLHPALGDTELWFAVLTGFGLLTMLTGAYLGLKQNDLKALLAYSTVSQLGVMVMLVGAATSIAFKAVVVSILAHALYKGALFLIVGIVDHETGTRDLRRLGGLGRAMPFTLAVAAPAALSMAGLPPLFGFLAKETLLASVTHPQLPPPIAVFLTAATVAAGALLLAQAGLLLGDVFFGRPRDPHIHGHEPPGGMLLAPAILTFLSLILGLLPEPLPLATFIATAATAAYGAAVKVSLALWAGVTVPFVLSVVAVSLGALIWWFRHPLRRRQQTLWPWFSFDEVYEKVLQGLMAIARLSTRTQAGQLRRYLTIMLAALTVMMLLWGDLPRPAVLSVEPLDDLTLLRVFTLVLATGAAAVSIVLVRDFFAILALSVSGLGVAVLMALEPAPDVALVQIVVDLLSVVLLTLALAIIPREQRRRAWELTYRQTRPGLLRDGLIAAAGGVAIAVLTLAALVSRPRPSVVTPYYEANAKPLAGASDIVGAIIVDFRGFDTLIEILVFSLGGLGVYALLRNAIRRERRQARAILASAVVENPSLAPGTRELHDKTIMGIGGIRASPFVRLLAQILLPVMMVVAIIQMMYGHDQAGDGFTAGVIISLVIALWYVAFGYEETRRQLPWLQPFPLVGTALTLALGNGAVAAFVSGSFFGRVDYGQLLGLSLPRGFGFSSSFVFELAICLTVLGGVALMLTALGHPQDET
jgi:multicomponent K+:H+ antiporter subunit A